MAAFCNRYYIDALSGIPRWCFSKLECEVPGQLTAGDVGIPYPNQVPVIIGYCEGLFCIQRGPDALFDFLIVNPTNRTFKTLTTPTNTIPPLPEGCPFVDCQKPCPLHFQRCFEMKRGCGFGRDVDSGKFNIIATVSATFYGRRRERDGRYFHQVFVYTLGLGALGQMDNNDGWKRVGFTGDGTYFPRSLHRDGVGVWVDGSCYWVCRTQPRGRVIARWKISRFDLKTMEFSNTSIPCDDILFSNTCQLRLLEISDILVLVAYTKVGDVDYADQAVRIMFRPRDELEMSYWYPIPAFHDMPFSRVLGVMHNNLMGIEEGRPTQLTVVMQEDHLPTQLMMCDSGPNGNNVWISNEIAGIRGVPLFSFAESDVVLENGY